MKSLRKTVCEVAAEVLKIFAAAALKIGVYILLLRYVHRLSCGVFLQPFDTKFHTHA